MKPRNRIVRINDEILKESATIIRSELKDPRLSSMTSVTKVDTSNDLKYCKIYVSIMGGVEQKKEALEGLKNANGFIRRMLAERINLRNTPELTFVLDDSMEYSMKINKLLKDIRTDTRDEQE